VGHALVSAYWALGGTALLDTIGGDLERWGWAIALLKLVVALAAPILAGIDASWLPAWTRGRIPRLLGWIAAGTLVVYGGLLTLGGLAVESGAIDAAADADRRALAWHAFLWDPWFCLWGVAFAGSLRTNR
jgi:hypothetical protein